MVWKKNIVLSSCSENASDNWSKIFSYVALETFVFLLVVMCFSSEQVCGTISIVLSKRYCLTVCFVNLSQMVENPFLMLNCFDFIDGSFKPILIIQWVKIFFIAQYFIESVLGDWVHLTVAIVYFLGQFAFVIILAVVNRTSLIIFSISYGMSENESLS